MNILMKYACKMDVSPQNEERPTITCVVFFSVINYAVAQCAQQWELFADTHSANGNHQSAGDATFAACLDVCVADTT